jgi:hypothetical protein
MNNNDGTTTVTLQTDQWPVVLKSLEVAAETYSRQLRPMAQATVLETRTEVERQVQENQEQVVRRARQAAAKAFWSKLTPEERRARNAPAIAKARAVMLLNRKQQEPQ